MFKAYPLEGLVYFFITYSVIDQFDEADGTEGVNNLLAKPLLGNWVAIQKVPKVQCLDGPMRIISETSHSG